MYVKITNGHIDQYPYTVGNLRRDNPNTSFPKKVSDTLLSRWGVYRVTLATPPVINTRTQSIFKNKQPELVSGSWVLNYTVTDKTAAEIAQYDEAQASANRDQRNLLIAETDWWASTDLTMTDEQTAYRQALRDITDHANWPHLDEADWPTKP